MKYKEFKQLVIENMPENDNPGLWQQKGVPQKHILGNPSTPKEKAELINKHSLLPNVPSVDCETIHLHQYAHHLNSSQIMCYNFFRPMMEDYNIQIKMYKPTDKLVDLIYRLIGSHEKITGSLCNFEYITKDRERTNFDFYYGNEDVEVFFEIKYTEQEFAKSSSAKNPHDQYDKVYKGMIKSAEEIFVGGTISENDFNTKYYQLARNAIRATSSNKYVLFVYPEANENLRNQFKDFSEKCLTMEGKKRVKLLTWETIVQLAHELCIDVTDFMNRYLAFFNDDC